ncbi:MAG: type II toxin-antitoxin system RelE/ParE family toxin [Methyloglobulus sp.]|nr:type II toxin-antitoxin system RelE/ParE family toxin [Methyloglobulus sp.]
MPRTIFSKKAEADLAEIYRYGFVNFGERQADQYADSLREKCQFLSENPLLYRERDEFSPPVRIGYHGKHLIIFTTEHDYILIVRILHGYMDVQNHLEF